jgi:hypothetical protein
MAAAASDSRPLPLLVSVLSSDRTIGASKELGGLVAIPGGPVSVTQGAKAAIRTELANDPGFTLVAYRSNANHNLVSSHLIDPLSSCPSTVFRLTRSTDPLPGFSEPLTSKPQPNIRRTGQCQPAGLCHRTKQSGQQDTLHHLDSIPTLNDEAASIIPIGFMRAIFPCK